MDTNIVQLFEALLNEATALEIYQQTQKDKMAPEVFAAILAMDPTSIMGEGANATQILGTTKKGTYSDWLLRQYKNAGGAAAQQRMITEDAQQIKKYLEIYKAVTTNKEGLAKLQQAITAAQLQIANIKDLNQFKSIAILAQALTPFMKASTEALSTKAENDIIVVYNDDTWQVVIPKTHAAARKYGTGTQWCTATSNSHHYNSYSKDGPLFIIRAKLLKDNDCRWQYHKHSRQFMDYKDDALSVRRFLTKYVGIWPEKTKAMAAAISSAAKSSAWDVVAFERDFAKDLAEFIKAIADADNDVNEAVLGKSPVVITAARRNDTAILDILLNQYKADPNVFDIRGTSALSFAIQAGSIDAVKLLLQAGSPEMMLSQREIGGNTPIHQISRMCNPLMLQAVLEKLTTAITKLAYLHVRNNNRNTPLMEAILSEGGMEDESEARILSIVELIVEVSDLSPSSGSQLAEVTRRILEEEDNNNIKPVSHILDLRNLDGHTATSLALSLGYLKVYNYLIQHGASLLAARKNALVATYFKTPQIFKDAKVDISSILSSIEVPPSSILATIENDELSKEEIAELVILSLKGTAGKISDNQLRKYYSQAFRRANVFLIKYMHETYPYLSLIADKSSILGASFHYGISSNDIISVLEYLRSQGWSIERDYKENEEDMESLYDDLPDPVVSWIIQHASPSFRKKFYAGCSLQFVVLRWYCSIYTKGVDISDLSDVQEQLDNEAIFLATEHPAVTVEEKKQIDKTLLTTLSLLFRIGVIGKMPLKKYVRRFLLLLYMLFTN